MGTAEGLGFVFTVMMLAFVVGFSFTFGMWAFCKLAKWAPVNMTINTDIYERPRSEGETA